MALNMFGKYKSAKKKIEIHKANRKKMKFKIIFMHSMNRVDCESCSMNTISSSDKIHSMYESNNKLNFVATKLFDLQFRLDHLSRKWNSTIQSHSWNLNQLNQNLDFIPSNLNFSHAKCVISHDNIALGGNFAIDANAEITATAPISFFIQNCE